jgi:hypothetical protein
MANRDNVARAAEGVLEPGEVVEVAALATFGGVSVGKTLAVAAATAIATAGLLSVTVTPKRMPIVLTTKRLLILGWKGVMVETPDSKILAQMDRSDLRAKPAKRVALYRQVDLTDVEGRPVARMKFGLFDGADASGIADRLGLPPSPAVALKK